jgi:hypothetical protein
VTCRRRPGSQQEPYQKGEGYAVKLYVDTGPQRPRLPIPAGGRVSRVAGEERTSAPELVWGRSCQAPDIAAPVDLGLLGARSPVGAGRRRRRSEGSSLRGGVIAPQPCIRRIAWIRTMMRPCASVARLRGGGAILRGGGAILNRGAGAMFGVGLPPPRTVAGDRPTKRRGRRNVGACDQPRAGRSGRRRAHGEPFRHITGGRQPPEPDEELRKRCSSALLAAAR